MGGILSGLGTFNWCICFSAFSMSWAWNSCRSKLFILSVTLPWIASINSALTPAWDEVNIYVKYSTKVLPTVSSSSCQTLFESLIFVMMFRWCLLEALVWKKDVLRFPNFSQQFLDLYCYISSSTKSILFCSSFVSWISSNTLLFPCLPFRPWSFS